MKNKRTLEEYRYVNYTKSIEVYSFYTEENEATVKNFYQSKGFLLENMDDLHSCYNISINKDIKENKTKVEISYECD